MSHLPDNMIKKLAASFSLVCVDGVVVKNNKVLLIRRATEPFRNQWVLPGGHVERGETTGQATVREIEEETGLVTRVTKYLGVYSNPNRDPRWHSVSNVYFCNITGGSLCKTSEAKESRFFGQDELPDKIGFDHRIILDDIFYFLKHKKTQFIPAIINAGKKRKWLEQDDFEKIVESKTLAGCGGAVFKNDKVLLIKRSMEPEKDMWAMPGGWVDPGETVEAAALREVKEETGVSAAITGSIGPYPCSYNKGHVITNIFLMKIVGGSAKSTAETNDARFFAEDELPPIAFSLDDAVKDAFKMLHIRRNSKENKQ